MKEKPKSIIIKYWAITGAYEVKEVVNYIDLRPGQTVAMNTVRKMCNDPEWTVTLISVDFANFTPPVPLPIP